MDPIILGLRAFVLLTFSFFTFNSNAATFTSINAGAWNDVVSVWSTDGGATACGCSPGGAIGTNTVIVNHILTVPFDIDVNGGVLTVNSTGEMNGSYNLVISSATVDIFGSMALDKYDQGPGSVVTLQPGAIVIASNNLTVSAGTLTLDAAVLNSGKLFIDVTGSVSLTNASRFFITSGNSEVDGTLNIGAGSCMESNGNWKVGSSGSVLGSGSFNSGGNINNNGFVAPTIIWCAQGAGLGMTSPENCAGATTICNAILLPVELSSFEAVVYEMTNAEITWSTASENNNSHFELESSRDGIQWNEVVTIKGAGTTTETQYYGYIDSDLPSGVTYYKITQVDFDGRRNSIEPVSIHIQNDNEPISAYPNPVSNGDVLHVKNVEDGTGTVSITNLSGRTVLLETFEAKNNAFTIPTFEIQSGIYILTTEQDGVQSTLRISVR